ncbi:MAG: hypothetical protein Roseis2KO_30680 [Roseivirga sp.]
MNIQTELLASLRRHGERVAIENGENHVTYAQLLKKANGVTSYLMGLDLAAETIVGIDLPDKVDIISTMIGVMNARCAFVLLDSSLPESRRANMMADMDLKHVISSATQSGDINYYGLSEISAEEGEYAYPEYHEDDTLYIYFTSGSTGTPKGIVGRNGSLLQFLQWEVEAFNIDQSHRFSQFISPYFDAFLRDVFVPLFAGATICLPPQDEDFFTPDKLISWIDKARISLIHCVPSLFRILNTESLSKDHFRELQYILMSGEKINPPELINWYRLFDDRIQLVNLYGATESTLIRSCYRISPEDTKRTRMPIGQPINDTELIVVTPEMKPCNLFIPGDLYIASDHLSKGYLNNPALTAEKFITIRKGTPQETTAFKTGDKARKLPGGLLDLLGREDRQIKLRGIRIELDEIESVLVTSDLLKNALVVVKADENGHESLVAFVIKKDGVPQTELFESAVLKHCSEHLPSHMIPSNIRTVDEYPLLSNGKINHKELLALLAPQKEIVLPSNATEEKLLKIWKDILGDKQISTEDSFHHIGGNSLTIMNLLSHVNKAFGVRISLGDLFKYATIQTQARFVDAANQQELMEIPRVAEAAHYPLSSAQKRLFFLHKFSPQSLAYNMPQVVRLKGELELNRLREALNKVLERHENLRATFSMEGEEPRQRIVQKVDIELEQFQASEEESDAIIKEFIRPFDLTQAPLLRVGIIRLSASEHLLMTDMHHIITDGVSQNILIKDFMAIFNNAALSDLKITYKDYADWSQSEAQHEAINKQRTFWKNIMSQGAIPIDLPTDFPRPLTRNHTGNVLSFRIGAEKTNRLKSIAEGEGATLFMVLLTVYNVLLSRLSGQKDITIGTPVTDRPHADLNQIIGMFVNTLVLRNSVDDSLTFNELLAQIKSNVISCFDHKEYPYEEMVDDLNVERDTSRNPLFDIAFDYRNFEESRLELSGILLEPFDRAEAVSKFDLTLRAREAEDAILLDFEYATQLFREDTINQFIAYFEILVSAVIQNPDEKISAIDILPSAEKEEILEALDHSQVNYPEHKTVVDLFEAQVQRTPDNLALKFEEQTLTYRELDQRTNQLAHVLRNRGVKNNTIVGLLIGRSVDTVISMLAILKAGGAYLPIDIDYPEERISYMIEDSGMPFLLTTNEIRTGLSYELTIISIEDALEVSVPAEPVASNIVPTNLCYIIYTSGTTGLPKGVMVEHRNVVRLLFNDGFQFDFGSKDVWTMFHSHCFDFSVWEMYGALLFGGKLIIIDKMVAKDTKAYLALLEEEEVTILNQTPSAFYNLIQEETLKPEAALSVRYVIFGGEALSPGKLKPWHAKYNHVKLVNMFGITETTVHVTYKELSSDDIEQDVSNIGKPIPTLSVYVLDQGQKLVPKGVVGEMYVGGAGITRGYLGKTDLTKEKFIPNPFQKGGQLYRTGDLARVLKSGDIEYIGRADDQVQIRGFRIELKEIAYQLCRHQAVQESVVLTKGKAEDKYLVAYYESKEEIKARELRDHLSRQLPDYMIPTHFVHQASFPLTSNGKLDKKRLPNPEIKTEPDHVAPSDEVQEKLVSIWSQLLNVDKELIGVNSSFFELGGNSLKMVRLSNMINETLEWDISVVDLFRFPSILSLTDAVKQKAGDGADYQKQAEAEVTDMESVLKAFD